ncbi:MAG: secretin N-terminal domain-containing protein, partial [Burkholderiaceae bacterium]
MTRHAFLPSTLRHTARNLALAAGAALAALTLQLGTAGTAHAQRAPEPVTLNFVNAEIDAVARTMATITGRNIVVDPRVKGTITLSTDKPVAPALAWNQFLATLRLSGFAVVDSAGLLKVVPEADAKLQGGPVQAEGAPPAGNQIVTQIFRLNHENPNSLVPLLRPLISPNNTINVNPGSNALVITDYADNLQRIARIIAALDVSNATDVEVLPLRHAVASDLAPLVARLMEGSGTLPLAAAPGQVADTSYRTQIIAEPRSNALVVRAANPARLNLVRSLVSKLDQPTSAQASGNIHVVYLKNADAVKLATTLRAAIAGTGGAGAASSGPLNLPAPTPGAQLGMAASAATAPVQPQDSRTRLPHADIGLPEWRTAARMTDDHSVPAHARRLPGV